jgi:MYXO-CTERM domain-containing protein
MRSSILVLLLMNAPALANTSSHSGGGGSSPTCIRWETIPYDLGARDMALPSNSDGGNSDGGAPLDMGGHAGQRCAEYASLFSCAMSGGGHDRSAALPIVGLLFVAILVRRRHRA